MCKYGLEPLTAKVLASFCYDDELIEQFINPLQKPIADEKAFDKIGKAFEQFQKENRKIFIFGDYDADGICATSIMVKILNHYGFNLGENLGYYIPNRLNEGYGLSVEKTLLAQQKGYDVIITVDNGVGACEALKKARELGMITVVTDHHIISEEVSCDYLLHPSILEKKNSYLCGCGIVYMLANYLGVADDCCKALAMIATIADVMELKGTNIPIIKEGLQCINKHKYLNVEYLSQMNFPVNEESISFNIIPKINAVGRMSEKPVSDVNNLVRFFLSTNENEILRFSGLINQFNIDRQTITREQYGRIEQCFNDDLIQLICLDDLHVGLLGLYASRAANQQVRICFICTEKDGIIRGSGRSVGNIDIMELLKGFADKALTLGGHAGACGISFEKEKLDEFRQYLKEKQKDLVYDTDEYYISVNEDELNQNAFGQLFSYRPFGQGRKLMPIKITLNGFDSYNMLKKDTQLKWRKNGYEIISFENKGYYHYLGKDKLTFIGDLKENIFRGNITYQIMVKEIIE